MAQRGRKRRLPASPPPARVILTSGLGAILAMAVVAALADFSGYPLVLGSFGASCVLLFGFPDSPFSRPRNVIGGHLLASLIGLGFLSLFGAHGWSLALAVGVCIAAMMATRTVHPPAGSNPVIIMLSSPDWMFLWTPTGIGALLLVGVALLFNHAARTPIPDRR
ncbi:MAG: HPP family protein [Zoogloeaceae bacterium]|jgi:CBS-domain-containing membrane protein|nr:HPP family protein [Zoogloeaceae bacterium]